MLYREREREKSSGHHIRYTRDSLIIIDEYYFQIVFVVAHGSPQQQAVMKENVVCRDINVTAHLHFIIF